MGHRKSGLWSMTTTLQFIWSERQYWEIQGTHHQFHNGRSYPLMWPRSRVSQVRTGHMKSLHQIKMVCTNLQGAWTSKRDFSSGSLLWGSTGFWCGLFYVPQFRICYVMGTRGFEIGAHCIGQWYGWTADAFGTLGSPSKALAQEAVGAA